jgi:predicted DsbA family dithiol-disulfide isomerase
VRKDIAEGQKLGITGTPTMLLGVSEGNQVKEVKMLRGAQPFSVFKAEVDKSLAAMAATP